MDSSVSRFGCRLACALLIGGWLASVGSGVEATPNREERLLLFHNGRVIEGRISQSAAGYVVERANGSVLFPFEQVRFVADDLPDAYRQQRDSLGKAPPEDHLKLAEWCLTYRLYDEARDELRRVLRQSPERDDARKLLARVEELSNPDRLPHRQEAPRKPVTADGYVVPEVQSLGGLSRETAEEFTLRVQPILMNKCANGSCHGPHAANEFRLTLVRGQGNHRLYAERNLATVMRYLNLDRPERSPLLTQPRGNHGGSVRSIFPGSTGAAQLRTLHDWVRNVAKDKGHEPSPAATSQVIVQTSAESISDVPLHAHQAAATNDEFLDGILRDQRPDPFDPNVFNRRYHGGRR